MQFYLLSTPQHPVNKALDHILKNKIFKKDMSLAILLFEILEEFINKEFLFGEYNVEYRLLQLFEILSNILIIISSIKISLYEKETLTIIYCSGPIDVDKDIEMLFSKVKLEEKLRKNSETSNIFKFKRNNKKKVDSFYYFSYESGESIFIAIA